MRKPIQDAQFCIRALLRTPGFTAVAVLALTLGVLASTAQSQTQLPASTASRSAFEVATVKLNPKGDPSGFSSYGMCHGIDSNLAARGPVALGRCGFLSYSLRDLIYRAYFRGVEVLAEQAIIGGPSWSHDDLYDVEGKAEDPATTTEPQLFLMLHKLLAERFKLQFHREQREVKGYALVAPKGAIKLRESVSDGPPSMQFGGGRIVATNVSMSRFASQIIGMVRGPVTGETGLKGSYDFTLIRQGEDTDSLIQDYEDQFGLRFEPRKVLINILVIDHAEKPLPN